MKKNIKNLISLGMILLIASTSFIGCGSSKGSINDKTKEVNEDNIKKPDKIKWFFNDRLTLDDGAEQWRQEYEKKTGISLEFTPQANNEYFQNLDLAFASKNEPDIFLVPGENKLSLYEKQGALADITDLVKSSKLWNTISKDVWDSITINGKIYGVPFETGTGTITYVRKDWLDRLGLEEPKNYEEFINILRSFKEKIPECRIPYTAPGLYENGAVSYLREFYQDATPEFTKVNDKWVDGMAQSNMVDALKRLQDAYKEGLIDVEIVTNTTATCRDKWYAGQVGAFNYWAGTWAVGIDDRLRENNPQAKAVPINSIAETNYYIRVPNLMCISSTSKNVPGVFKYFGEYMHDGGEGQVLFQYGVENLHWKQVGDKVVMQPKLSKPSEKLEQAILPNEASPTQIELKDKKIDIDERVTKSIDTLKKNSIQKIAMPASKKLTKINSDLRALRSQIISKVVMGDMSAEAGINSYISESKNLGMDEILEEMNK